MLCLECAFFSSLLIYSFAAWFPSLVSVRYETFPLTPLASLFGISRRESERGRRLIWFSLLSSGPFIQYINTPFCIYSYGYIQTSERARQGNAKQGNQAGIWFNLVLMEFTSWRWGWHGHWHLQEEGTVFIPFGLSLLTASHLGFKFRDSATARFTRFRAQNAHFLIRFTGAYI